MKGFIVLLCLLFSTSIVIAQNIESKIRSYARKEYPNNERMQNFIYEKQMTDYKFMLNVTDYESKRKAESKYPDNYSMQKFVYENEIKSKRSMND
jgi:hypothetical protein